jgi:flavodoxin
MRKIFTILLAALLALSLAACAGKASRNPAGSDAADHEAGTVADDAHETDTSSDDTPVAPPEESETDDPEQNSGKVLVVVFSATGTTKGVAEKIAAIENADLYEIKAAQKYTSDDLNWNDGSSRTTREQNDKNARPEIGSESISLEGYEKIYIGYPIWWGEEPRILDTFVESYSFDGITMIPFCTSSSSGIGRSGQNLADHAGSGNWLEGKRFSGSVTEADLQSWIDSMK